MSGISFDEKEYVLKIIFIPEDKTENPRELEVIVPLRNLPYDEDGMRAACFEVCPLKEFCLEDSYDICSRITEAIGFADWDFDIPEESSKSLADTLIKLIGKEDGGLVKKRIFKRKQPWKKA